MRIRLFPFIALVAAFMAVGLRAAPENQAKDETELEDKMDVMGTAFRKLKRQVNDATQNAASLRLVATLRAAAEEAKTLVPAKAADIPESERAQFVASYRAKMTDLLATLGQLEAALQAGKNNEAVRLVAELVVMQKTGHKTFKRPDDKD
jgi:soluble cytochrome b562